MHKTIAEIHFNIQVYAASWQAMCKASAAIAEGLAKLAAGGGASVGFGGGVSSDDIGQDKQGAWSLNDVVSGTSRKWCGERDRGFWTGSTYVNGKKCGAAVAGCGMFMMRERSGVFCFSAKQEIRRVEEQDPYGRECMLKEKRRSEGEKVEGRQRERGRKHGK